MRFVPERELREQVKAAIAVLEVELESALPACEVEHIGATSVPGALTKGDVDVLVRVSPDRYEAAMDAVRSADVVVVRFGDKYRQWNAAFEAGYAAALGKPLITLHDTELTHALKEVDRAALATAETPEQVVEILAYAVAGPGVRS